MNFGFSVDDKPPATEAPPTDLPLCRHFKLLCCVWVFCLLLECWLVALKRVHAKLWKPKRFLRRPRRQSSTRRRPVGRKWPRGKLFCSCVILTSTKKEIMNTRFKQGSILTDFIILFSPRSMSKSSSEIDEEGAFADGESSRSDLAPAFQRIQTRQVGQRRRPA